MLYTLIEPCILFTDHHSNSYDNSYGNSYGSSRMQGHQDLHHNYPLHTTCIACSRISCSHPRALVPASLKWPQIVLRARKSIPLTNSCNHKLIARVTYIIYVLTHWGRHYENLSMWTVENQDNYIIHNQLTSTVHRTS